MSGAEGSPRRFVRTRRGRLIGGVASGLGSYFRVDPLLFRIGFVGLAFFGGIGAGLYLLILLFVPEEGASRAPIRVGSLHHGGWLRLLGWAALVVAALLVLHQATHAAFDSDWGIGFAIGLLVAAGGVATAAWWRLRSRAPGARPSADRKLFKVAAFAVAVGVAATLLSLGSTWIAGTAGGVAPWMVVAVGAALVASAFTGGARWLVLPAISISLPVAVVFAADVDLHGGVGERVHRPSGVQEVRDRYRLGAGRLEVDLRQVDFPPGGTRVALRLGMGEVVLLVPEEVCVLARAEVGAGYVGALDRETGGLDVDWSNRAVPPPGTPRLVVDGKVGLGALFIADRPFDRGGRGGWKGSGRGFQPGLHGRNEACRGRRGMR